MDLSQAALAWLVLRVIYIPCYLFGIIYLRSLGDIKLPGSSAGNCPVSGVKRSSRVMPSARPSLINRPAW